MATKRKQFLLPLIVTGIIVGSIGLYLATNQHSRGIVHFWVANPSADVAAAVSRGDRRFIGIYGYSLSIPGLPGSEANSLVKLYGVNPVEGTSDAYSDPFQGKFQELAKTYGERYNTLLTRQLLSHPDAATRSLLIKARRELEILGKADPTQDAVRAFHSGSPHFIDVLGERSWWNSLDENDDSSIYYYPQHSLLADASLFRNTAEAQRLNQVFQNYVIPYNQMLLRLLKQKKPLASKNRNSSPKRW